MEVPAFPIPACPSMDKPARRWWAKVTLGSIPDYAPELGPCWFWAAYVSSYGYGLFRDNLKDKMVPAHRWGYEMFHGTVDADLDMDHLCRVRHCVNPRHLEPVTRQVNILRGETFQARNAAVTACPKGHDYDDVNTVRDKQGRRRCRTCVNTAGREYMRRKRAEAES